MEVHRVRVPIRLSADEFLRYYRGTAKNVYARDLEGRMVQFPANLLQKFVTQEGIEGLFEISFAPGGKLIGIQRLDNASE